MKKINYNYFYIPHYFYHLLVFLIIFSFILAITITDLNYANMSIFLVKYVCIFLGFLILSTLLELKEKSEYINPLEIIKVKNYYKEFIENPNNHENYINKYNQKTIRKYKKIFTKNKNYDLISVRKNKDMYKLTIVDKNIYDIFYIFKFLIRRNNYKLYVKADHEGYKIININ